MGKAKQNVDQMPMGQTYATCPHCGASVDPSWEVCPECQNPLAGPMKVQPAGMGYEDEKTLVIDKQALPLREKRKLVGWLVALTGFNKDEDFRIYDGKNLIGTAADCDIVITDPYMSSKHSTLKHERGNFILIDLDSTNGTYVNQKRITKMELIDNDTIRLGKTEFKFKSLY